MSGESFTPYSWLTACPARDCNFKGALKNASDDDLTRARNKLIAKPHSKTAIKAIEAEQRQRRKKSPYVLEHERAKRGNY